MKVIHSRPVDWCDRDVDMLHYGVTRCRSDQLIHSISQCCQLLHDDPTGASAHSCHRSCYASRNYCRSHYLTSASYWETALSICWAVFQSRNHQKRSLYQCGQSFCRFCSSVDSRHATVDFYRRLAGVNDWRWVSFLSADLSAMVAFCWNKALVMGLGYLCQHYVQL